jgi:mannose-1-phosphate guanylyltransferase
MKVIIFCGGYGTRMWPVGRKDYPKQFFPVVRGKSFFQISYERFKKGFSPEDIYVSTERKYEHFVRKQAPDLPTSNIIVEPERRDSLGAIGLVSAIINKKFGNEVMFFSWSDHFISRESEFIKIVKAALKYTEETSVPVSINEEPTFPSIHNGWVEQGKKVASVGEHPLHSIVRFIEKPKLETAKKYLRDSHYFIHTGYASWRADKMLEYYKEFRPKEYKGLMKIADSYGTNNFESTLKVEYPKFEKVSVEIGLYEKLPNGLRLNIPMSVGWKDAGTWYLYYDALLEKGGDTVIDGENDTVQIDSFKNLIVSSNKKRLIATIGIKNIAIIDTEDALLIMDLDSTHKVKDLFGMLEKEKPDYIK